MNSAAGPAVTRAYRPRAVERAASSLQLGRGEYVA
jgi:hypothetical protein